MTEFQRPTFPKEEISRTTEAVLKYIEASDKDGFYPSDISEALDMDYWLVQDAFDVLVEQGVLDGPVASDHVCGEGDDGNPSCEHTMTESELHKHESGTKPFEDPTDMLDSCDCGAIRFKGSAIWFVPEA